jgi:uncharacterized protein (TIGR02145 family)
VGRIFAGRDTIDLFSNRKICNNMNVRIIQKPVCSILLFIFLLVLSSTCKKDDLNKEDPKESKQVEKMIIASEGGTLTTSDSLQLIIPANALPVDGTVFIGRTGNEPFTVPNKNLEILGRPFTIKFPSNSIADTLTVSFPKPSNAIDTNTCSIVLFNGTSYFPVKYTIEESSINVIIDLIEWESGQSKGILNSNSRIISILKDKQIPPSNEMGLKKVNLDQTGNLVFSTPSANPGPRILLLIHGWIGRASTWNTFISRIEKETNPEYSEIWAYSYNSSFSIKENARILSEYLAEYSLGTSIDIVAHSMGGLVARSLIEQWKGAAYIDKLIMVGTPNKGSKLALFRYLLGALVKIKDNTNYPIYNYNTQGFKDLNEGSYFLYALSKSECPKTSYFAIASINDYFVFPRNELETGYLLLNLATFLPGPSDGIVLVTSAKGAPGAISPEKEIQIHHVIAHMDMTDNEDIYNQVLIYLRLGKPSVSTSTINSITKTTADVGGIVTGVGGSEVIDRGVFWGQSQNPDLTGTKIPIGNGAGSFSATLSGLSPLTTYYVKAYATNSAGTAYGNEIKFRTIGGEVGSVTDFEGNIYKTVVIGSQTWMAENLRTVKFNDGTNIPIIPSMYDWQPLTTPGCCWNNSGTGYGVFYNWYSLETASNGGKNVCPEGWHIPSDVDWNILSEYLGGDFVAGGKLKEEGTSHWSIPNSATTNESGFTALPGGMRNSIGVVSGGGLFGYWWTLSEDGVGSAWNRTLSHMNSISRLSELKNSGLSVRCLKDTEPFIAIPTLTTQEISDITLFAATSGGIISSDGGASITAKGICWSALPNPVITNNYKTNDGTGTGSFTSLISDLVANTTYYVKAYATNSAGTGYGNEISFKTTGGQTGKVTDVEGNTYSTITIGTQTWMAENLKTTSYNDNSKIPYVPYFMNWVNLTTPGYCWYRDSPDNIYGALYNWYSLDPQNNGSKNVCPVGWHVPTDDQWTVLTDYLTNNQYGFEGSGDDIAKSLAAQSGWNSWVNAGSPGNDMAGNNSSGFTALPGGYCSSGGIRLSSGTMGYWWTSSDSDVSSAWYRSLSYISSSVARSTINKNYGYSIRCLKD